jgi:nickel-dependent lactate racemase
VKIRLAYGKKGLDIDLRDDLNFALVEPKYVQGLTKEAKSVRDVLRRPIASKPLRDLVNSTDKVAIVFNDITRPTPYHVILPVLLDALDHDSHKFVGTAKSGNEIWLHKEYVECNVRILTGFIEPHFIAGFSGGGKACMPGLALLETVLRNHSVSNLDHPKVNWGITQGNPVAEEILEAASMVPMAFLLNVALNRDKQITGVFAGDLEESHKQGCKFVKENAMVPVKEPYDIVITSNSGHPLDLNLYQSIKGISAASQIVKDGGSIIMAADCWDGLPDHGEYARLLLEAVSPQHLLQTMRAPGFSMQDMWQAQIQAQVLEKADVYFYSENLSDEQIIGAMLKPCHSIEAVVYNLARKYGRGTSICVLPEGPQTIPYICGP